MEDALVRKEMYGMGTNNKSEPNVGDLTKCKPPPYQQDPFTMLIKATLITMEMRLGVGSERELN